MIYHLPFYEWRITDGGTTSKLRWWLDSMNLERKRDEIINFLDSANIPFKWEYSELPVAAGAAIIGMYTDDEEFAMLLKLKFGL